MNKAPRQTVVNEEEQYAGLKGQVRASGLKAHIKYLPAALIFSFVGILLFVTVGGVSMKTDMVYIAGVYGIGVAGLTMAYSRVATWMGKQKKGSTSATEQMLFTLFYNNAFYVFLVFLGSHLVFSGLQPITSMVLTQLVAVFLPAWLASLSK